MYSIYVFMMLALVLLGIKTLLKKRFDNMISKSYGLKDRESAAPVLIDKAVRSSLFILVILNRIYLINAVLCYLIVS